MKKKITVILLVGFLTAILTAQENSTVTLTVEEAVSYALQNNRVIKSAAIDLNTKHRATDIAWNTLLPSIDLSAGASRANEIVTVPDVIVTESDHWTLAGGAGVSLSFNAALLANIKAAHIDYEAGQITWKQTQKNLERDVRKLFYRLLLLQENIALQENSLTNAETRTSAVRANYQSGRASEMELLEAQMAFESQKPELLRQKQTLRQNFADFAVLLGMDAGTQLALMGEITPVTTTGTVDDAVLRNTLTSDVQLLQKSIDVLSLNRRALDAGIFIPTIQLSWGVQPVVAYSEIKNSNAKSSDIWHDNGSFSASIVWNLTNLLPFSANRQQKKDIDDGIAKTRIALEGAKAQAENNIRQLVDMLELSESQITALEGHIALAQRNYELSEAAYRAGRADFQKLRNVELQLFQARVELLNEQYNKAAALLDLEYMIL